MPEPAVRCVMTGSRERVRCGALWVLAGWLLALCGLLAGAPVSAASLGISPLLVDMSAGQSVAAVRVSNQHPEQAVTVQARLLRWYQEEGEERYAPADDLALSPPVTRIEPGREHLIRLVRNGPPPVAGEVSYRLLLDELPVPGAAAEGVAVSMVLRQSLPVFVGAAQVTPAQPQWRVVRVPGADGGRAGYRVEVRNEGGKRLRLASLVLRGEDGEVRAQRRGLVGYVLGHSEMGFLIPDVDGAEGAAVLGLTVQVESGELQVGPLVVEGD